jgi:hypothetical protein
MSTAFYERFFGLVLTQAIRDSGGHCEFTGPRDTPIASVRFCSKLRRTHRLLTLPKGINTVRPKHPKYRKDLPVSRTKHSVTPETQRQYPPTTPIGHPSVSDRTIYVSSLVTGDT